MTILLLGKNGQVGRELQRTLLPLGRVVALDRNGADIGNADALLKCVRDVAPKVIVNAAAYTAVDKAESEPEIAFVVNAAAPEALAGYCRQAGALLIHYSTDYVFDGTKAGAYLETDATNPLSVYGRSKRAGEEAIEASGCAHLTLRTSWVFSAHGNNFIKTILRLAQQREALNIVDDQVGAPTSAELIADVTALALAAYRRNHLATGIYHLAASGEATWHAFARHIAIAALARGCALKLGPEQIHPIPTEQYPLPAMRPRNSRLSSRKLADALGLQLPDWTLHVNRTLDQLLPREEKR